MVKTLKYILPIAVILIAGVAVYLYWSNSNKSDYDYMKSECSIDTDCPSGYTCQCTGIIPDCDFCLGGACIYTCEK